MAAVYVYNTEGADLFKGGVAVLSSVRLQFLEDLLSNLTAGRDGNLTIITELSMQNSETVQFFLTFDDLISWFYFGKGMGSISIRGLMLTNDKGTPGLPVLLSTTMRNLRGQQVGVSIGNAVFSCVMTNFTLHMTQDPTPVAEFVLNLNIVDHNLPIDRPLNTSCEYNPANEPIDYSNEA